MDSNVEKTTSNVIKQNLNGIKKISKRENFSRII